MQENDFEKSVQKKMEGLQLTPSASVWNEVRERIRTEKRKRRMAFWWMLPLILAAGGTIFYFSQVKKTATGVIAHQETPGTSNPDGTTNSPVKVQPVTSREQSIAVETEKQQTENNPLDQLNNTRETADKITVVRAAKVTNHRQAQPTINKTNYIADNSGVKTNRNVADDIYETKETTLPTGVSPVQPVYNLPDVKTEKTNEHIMTADVTGPVNDRPDMAVLHKDEPVVAKAKAEVKTPEKTKEPESPLKISTKKKWETGLISSLGVSARVEPLTFGSFAKGGSANQQNASLPNSPTYAPPGALYGRSLFQAGVYARKQFSARTAFSTGLVYASYSTKQETGMFIDSILVIRSSGRQGYVRADGFYRSGKIYIYNNKYYLVQLPLTFEWTVNPGSQVPVSWVNGLTPSLIAGSNSLVYNPTTATYYKDKTAYNNFQLFYHTGFAARFGEDSKHPVTAGVVFNYGIIGLHKNTSTEKNNLMSFGFQLKYALKK